MPMPAVHGKIERLIFNRTFPKVHKLIDVASFFNADKCLHDETIAYWCGYFLYGWKGGLAALLHVNLDKACNDQIIGKKKPRGTFIINI